MTKYKVREIPIGDKAPNDRNRLLKCLLMMTLSFRDSLGTLNSGLTCFI